MKKIYLIDGNALIYRMFFAIPNFTTKNGKQVNAIFGVAKFFMQDLVRDNPDYLVFIRDARGENFRHQIYSEYKATRDRMPDNLRTQVDDINDMVSLFHMDVIEVPMVEADDVIATLATKLSKDKSNQIFILSGDKDLYSLVSDNVKIYDTIKKDTFDIEKTTLKFGVKPEMIIDYLAINGDSSDNIPGINGIGPKKAVPLINKIGTVEDIYNFIDSGNTHEDEEINKILSGKTLEKITEAREIAFLSKKLATIKKDVDLGGFNLEHYKFYEDALLNDKIVELFKKYEFNSLLPNNERQVQKTWNDLDLKVQIIGDNEGLENLKKLLDPEINSGGQKYNEIVLDTETTSLDIIKAELVGVSILLDEKNIYYINVGHNGPKVDKSKLRDFLNYLLNSDITIIGHNIKYDLEIIELFLKKTENGPVSGGGEQKFEKKEAISNNNFGQMTLEL
ncbi:MAG: 5'-3' exonuclease H3TH domain-containing protein [Candidatus Gracilibacteria bacterium]